MEDGILEEAILNRYKEEQRAILKLNVVLQNGTINSVNKKRIDDIIAKSIIKYRSEVWPLKENIEERLKITEMNY